ncbi:MAG TPA: hypothetical protein VGR21_02745 [Cryptosporangiaceae bacterium]|nr:hypothetical protein [Cryptosporangiaceae bacterium]
MALAVDYPAPSPSLTVSEGTVVVGESVTVSGTGFGSGDTVAIDLTYVNGGGGGGGGVPAAVVTVVRASPDGTFSTAVRFGQVGLARITATGSPSGLSASVTVRVLPADSDGSALPITGRDGLSRMAVIAVGGAALVVGFVLVLLALRRRRGVSN